MNRNSKPDSYNYTISFVYECYMKLCYRTSKRYQIHCHYSTMKNLLDAEDGIIYTFLPSKEKQFKEVQNRMLKALSYFEKRKHEEVEHIRVGILSSTTGTQLCDWCRYTLDKYSQNTEQ